MATISLSGRYSQVTDEKLLVHLWIKTALLPLNMTSQQLEIIKNYCKKPIEWDNTVVRE